MAADHCYTATAAGAVEAISFPCQILKWTFRVWVCVVLCVCVYVWVVGVLHVLCVVIFCVSVVCYVCVECVFVSVV